MNHGEALAWLDAHVNLESGIGVPASQHRRATRPTLARIQSLLELLGSPQVEYPVVHVTGTNGKTTFARVASALLTASGLATGTYTSPHLERVNERMARDGEPIDDESLADLLAAVAVVEPFVDEQPSYFEVVTAAALRWFGDLALDVAVVEVGLGGTWDATNTVDGAVAVVTNVSIDHVEYLGRTREEIAAEKAGIVKDGSILVLGETAPELVPIFLDRGAAQVLQRGADFGATTSTVAHGGRVVSIRTPGASYDDLYLPLHGAHQADNAAIALVAAEAFLGRPLEHDVVADAFARVRSPGRLEVVAHAPLVLLDGAHNVAGAAALRVALTEEFPAAQRTLVVGLLREKEAHEMLAAFGLDDVAHLVCCRPPSPRAHEPATIAEAARDLGLDDARIEVVDDVARAVARARELAGESGQVVVTGSLYLVGAARHDLVGGEGAVGGRATRPTSLPQP